MRIAASSPRRSPRKSFLITARGIGANKSQGRGALINARAEPFPNLSLSLGAFSSLSFSLSLSLSLSLAARIRICLNSTDRKETFDLSIIDDPRNVLDALASRRTPRDRVDIVHVTMRAWNRRWRSLLSIQPALRKSRQPLERHRERTRHEIRFLRSHPGEAPSKRGTFTVRAGRGLTRKNASCRSAVLPTADDDERYPEAL